MRELERVRVSAHPWFRLGVNFPMHPRWAGSTPMERLAFVGLVSYATEHDTDGDLPNASACRAVVAPWTGYRAAARAFDALVARGIVRARDADVSREITRWTIDGWLDNNPSSEQRRAKSEAARASARARWGNTDDAKRNANASSERNAAAYARTEKNRTEIAPHDANASSAAPRSPTPEGVARSLGATIERTPDTVAESYDAEQRRRADAQARPVRRPSAKPPATTGSGPRGSGTAELHERVEAMRQRAADDERERLGNTLDE
jgi:hypothetical protein